MTFRVPNQYRIRRGSLGSDDSYGCNGAFMIPHPNAHSLLFFKVIASDGEGWEHVSVSLPSRCPTWTEMCHIKAMFWDDEDCVIQFHPSARYYVNNHPYCLHLWRPTDQPIPQPPPKFVGVLA